MNGPEFFRQTAEHAVSKTPSPDGWVPEPRQAPPEATRKAIDPKKATQLNRFSLKGLGLEFLVPSADVRDIPGFLHLDGIGVTDSEANQVVFKLKEWGPIDKPGKAVGSDILMGLLKQARMMRLYKCVETMVLEHGKDGFEGMVGQMVQSGDPYADFFRIAGRDMLEKGYGASHNFRTTRTIRDELCTRGLRASDVPTQHMLLGIDSEFQERVGDCMATLLQAEDSSEAEDRAWRIGARHGVVGALQNLYQSRHFGGEDPEVVEEAVIEGVNLVKKAITPIRGQLMDIIGATLGPAPKADFTSTASQK